MQPDSGPNGDFFKFCDALEVKNGVSAPAAGWGLDNALQAWGSYWKNSFYVQSTLKLRHLLYFPLISLDHQSAAPTIMSVFSSICLAYMC